MIFITCDVLGEKGHFFHRYVAVALGALLRTKPEGYDLFCIKILEDCLFYL